MGSNSSSLKKGCSSGLLYLPIWIQTEKPRRMIFHHKSTIIFSKSRSYQSMKLLGFTEHELDQGTVNPIHSKRTRIVCIGIIGILSPFKETENDAIFLPNQRVSDALES